MLREAQSGGKKKKNAWDKPMYQDKQKKGKQMSKAERKRQRKKRGKQAAPWMQKPTHDEPSKPEHLYHTELTIVPHPIATGSVYLKLAIVDEEENIKKMVEPDESKVYQPTVRVHIAPCQKPGQPLVLSLDILSKGPASGPKDIRRIEPRPQQLVPDVGDSSGPRGMARLVEDCSVVDCLAAFTDPELLSGSDSYGCEACSRAQAEEQRRAGVASPATAEDANDHKELEENDNKDNDDDSDGENAVSPARSPSTSSDEGDADDSDDTEAALERKSSKQADEDEVEVEDEEVPELSVPLVKRPAHKRVMISQLPSVLTVHLKRFVSCFINFYFVAQGEFG